MEPIQNQCFNNEQGDSGRETLWALAPRGRCPHPGGRDGPLGTPSSLDGPPTDRHYWGSLPWQGTHSHYRRKLLGSQGSP